MRFFIKKTKALLIIFVFMFLFSVFVHGKEKSTQDISYWYLEQISGLLRVTYSTQLVYPEQNSISVVSAEKVFGNKLSTIIESIVDGYKESPSRLPKGLTPRDIETKAWSFLYLSWFMPADKWKLLEQKTDTQFKWNRLGFPILWDKEPNDEGEINTVIGGWVETIPKKTFYALKEHAIKWLTPEKQNVKEILTSLRNGNIVEKNFAIRMLIRKHDVKTLPLIAKYLSSKDLQNTCLLAFQEMGTNNDIPTLIKAFYLPKANVSEIVKVMCKIGGKSVDTELSAWLNDPDLSYRAKEQIRFGILQAKYKPAIKILRPFLKDKKCAKAIESLLKKLGYFPKIKGSISKKVKSKSGVIVALILSKEKFKPSESVIMKLRVINNSEAFIYLNRSFRPKVFYQTLHGGGEVSMTRYGKKRYSLNSFFRGHFSPPGGMPFAIKPGKYYSEKINLSQIFDLSLTSNYLISCDINYYIKENKKQQKETLKIENLRIKIK